MKKQFFLLTGLAVFFSAVSSAQTPETPTSIGKGRILTTDGEKIKFTNFNFGSDAHNFQNPSTGKWQTIPAANVIGVQQQSGNEAGKWALWLGLSGLVGSTLGVLSAQNDAESLGVDTDQVNFAPIVIGITAGSALIGAAIGAGKKKYKTAYTNPKYETTSVPQPVRIGLTCSSHQGLGVGVQFGF